MPSKSIERRLRLVLREKADLLEIANCRIRDLENELEAERIGKAMLQAELEKKIIQEKREV